MKIQTPEIRNEMIFGQLFKVLINNSVDSSVIQSD